VMGALKKRDVKAVAKELQSPFNNKLQALAPIKSEDQRCPPSRVLPKMLASNLAGLQRSAPIVARSAVPSLPSYLENILNNGHMASFALRPRLLT
jgi:hypothetical protein